MSKSFARANFGQYLVTFGEIRFFRCLSESIITAISFKGICRCLIWIWPSFHDNVLVQNLGRLILFLEMVLKLTPCLILLHLFFCHGIKFNICCFLLGTDMLQRYLRFGLNFFIFGSANCRTMCPLYLITLLFAIYRRFKVQRICVFRFSHINVQFGSLNRQFIYRFKWMLSGT